MLYALSIGELFDGVEIISRQIFRNSELLFKPKSARTCSWFGFFFCDFTLVTCVGQHRLRTDQACSNSSSTSSTDPRNFFWSALSMISMTYDNLAKYLDHGSSLHPLLILIPDRFFHYKKD